MLTDAALAPAPDRAAAVVAAWNNLTASGPTLNASERHAVIRAARAAWAGGDPATGDPMTEAAHWLAVDAGGMTGEAVADFEARGLDRHRYLEVVGLVARLSNVDFYARGLGATVPDLPSDSASSNGAAPGGASPTGHVITDDPRLTDDVGWVPSVGKPFAPGWLDVFPDEAAALFGLHESMYVPLSEVGNGEYADELSKAQIEYVAARTSYLNECFY